jgi:hypothetical protein
MNAINALKGISWTKQFSNVLKSLKTQLMQIVSIMGAIWNASNVPLNSWWLKGSARP